MRYLHRMRDLRTDRRGLSVIELGLSMPILSVLMLGLIDVSSVYSAQVSLQQAAARSLERVQVSGYGTDFTYVKAEAAAAAGVPESQVTVTTWLECNNVKQLATVTLCPGTQVAGRYVQVAITATYTPWFPYSPMGERNGEGKIPMSATSSVRYG